MSAPRNNWQAPTVHFGTRATKDIEALADAAEMYAMTHLRDNHFREYADVMAKVVKVRWAIDRQIDGT